MYPTHKVKAGDWTVELFEDTVAEHEALTQAWKDNDWPKVYECLSPLIKSADWTDRAGNKLGTSSEEIAKIPAMVIGRLFRDYCKAMAGESDPKEASASKPISPPAPETKQ